MYAYLPAGMYAVLGWTSWASRSLGRSLPGSPHWSSLVLLVGAFVSCAIPFGNCVAFPGDRRCFAVSPPAHVTITAGLPPAVAAADCSLFPLCISMDPPGGGPPPRLAAATAAAAPAARPPGRWAGTAAPPAGCSARSARRAAARSGSLGRRHASTRGSEGGGA